MTDSPDDTAASPVTPASPTSILANAVPSSVAVRAELEDLVVRELLGPAGGPVEEVDESRVSDRYLVGILVPRRTQSVPRSPTRSRRTARARWKTAAPMISPCPPIRWHQRRSG